MYNIKFFSQIKALIAPSPTKPLALLALFFSCILVIYSCEKENAPTGESPSNQVSTDRAITGSSCGDALSGTTVLELIQDEEDAVNNRNNMILYHYGQALRIVIQNPTFLCFLEEAMIAEPNQSGVSLVTLSQQNPAFKTALNNALRVNMLQNYIYPRGVEPGIEGMITTTGWDASTYLTSKFEYLPYKYEPTVHFVKAPTSCQTNRPTTIVIVEDVDECDDVAGWRGAEEVLVSEAEAQQSADPIIFLGPGQGIHTNTGFATDNSSDAFSSQEEVSMGSGQNGFQVSDRADVDIDVDVHQIKAGHRYESSSRSEISGIITMFRATDPSGVTASFWQDFEKGEREISKTDINNSKIFESDYNAFLIPSSLFDSGLSRLFYMTYEHDWYADKKTFWNPCNPDPALAVWARMKYSHEWYFLKCGGGVTLFPSVGSIQTNENEKCKFVLKRTM